MKNSLRFLLVLFTLLTISVSSNATHVAGGNITYTYLGNNSYYVQMTLYRDCISSLELSPTQTLYASSSCWPSPPLQVILQRRTGPMPGDTVSNTPCASFTTCYEEHLYEGILTLPINCTDWNMWWGLCCRNGTIDNLQNPLNHEFYINATLNSIAAPNNSSPTFNFNPVQVFCVNQETYFDWGIVERDGDSLVFSFANPVSYDGGIANPTLVNIPFTGALSTTCPFPTTPACSMTIDPNTGIIHFTPSQVGEFVFAILVQEFNSNGVLIGSVVRDIQINVVANCILLTPEPDPVIAYDPNDPTVGIYLSCGTTEFIFKLDSAVVQVQCESVARDGSDFRIIGPYNNPGLVPIISADTISCADGLVLEILITLYQPLKNGTYDLIVKTGNDGNTLIGECGYAIADNSKQARLIVNDTTQLQLATAEINCHDVSVLLDFPQGFDCSTLTSDNSDFILVDEFGNPHTINSISSSDCDQSQEYGYQLNLSFTFGATIPDTLYLLAQTGSDTNTIANRCGNFSDVGDALAMIVVGGSIPVDLGSDLIVCDYNPIPLLDAGVVANSYTWTLNSDPTPIGTGQTFQPTIGGMYTVVVADGPSCTGADVINIAVTPSPQINLGPNVAYCLGDPIQDLDASINGIDPTYIWTFNGSPLGTQPIITPGQTGLYVVEVNIGAQCLGYDSIFVEFVQELTVTINGQNVLCSGESTDLVTDIIGPNPDTYQWTFNGNPFGGNTPSINVIEGGTYSVLATSATGCSGTQDIQITTEEYPIAPTISCASVTNGLYTYQWTNVPGAISYEVSVDGGVSWIDAGSATQYQTNIATSSFMVQAFNGTVCSPGPVSRAIACEIVIPNVITPAIEDGKNDVFLIKNLIQYPDNNIKIFNRWGNLVYDKDKYGLDGYWWNGGSSLSGGVYFYVINLNDGNEPLKGTLTVIK